MQLQLGLNERKNKAKEYEGEVVKIIAATHPTWQVFEPSSNYSRVDGIVIDNRTQQLEAVWETKCRNLSLAKVVQYGNELMIDYHKLEALEVMSGLLRVEWYLFTYLLQDGVVLKTKISKTLVFEFSKTKDESERLFFIFLIKRA